MLFLIKKQKSNHFSTSDWWGNTKHNFKEDARTFSKNSTTHKDVKILKLKDDCKTYRKKKTSNQKLNRWLKAYKTNFTCLKDRTSKIKQYLNYILMIINQNVLAILNIILSLKKKFKTLHQANFHSCYYWISYQNF